MARDIWQFSIRTTILSTDNVWCQLARVYPRLPLFVVVMRNDPQTGNQDIIFAMSATAASATR
jgi:hypothetical protein